MIENPDTLAEGAKVLKKFWDLVGPSISKKLGEEYEKHKVLIGKHLMNSYNKNSSVKLLSSKTVPVPLHSVYVNNRFVCKDRKEKPIDDLTLIEDIRQSGRVIVRGNGGSGKTFFLKYFWNRVFEDPRGTVPVYLELRKFNDFNTQNLESFIKHTLTSGGALSESAYQSILNSGSAVIILDGYDELLKANRTDVERQILAFEEKYGACPMVVSSRSNSTFLSWTNFTIFDVVGFNLEQVKELVKKSNVPESTRKKFLSGLNEDFYEEHKTFLEIPLLALMMLLTFQDPKTIPDNLDSFYTAVFMTLFQNHDILKETFTRPKCLKLIELQRFFAVFCFLTYTREVYEFNKIELLNELKNTKNFLNKNLEFDTPIDAEIEDILHDLEESMNLLFLDGNTYLFVHRSFQEYFTAYFIIKMEDVKTKALLYKFSERYFDSVLKICHQMKPSAVISKFVVPKFLELSSQSAFERIGKFEDIKTLTPVVKVSFIFTIMSNTKGDQDDKKVFGLAVLGGEVTRFISQLFELKLIEQSNFPEENQFRSSSILNTSKERKYRLAFLELYERHKLPQYVIEISETGFELSAPKITLNEAGLYVSENVPVEKEDFLDVMPEDFSGFLEEQAIETLSSCYAGREKIALFLRGLANKKSQTVEASLSDLYNF